MAGGPTVHVIGAGLVGSLAALALARRGAAVTLIGGGDSHPAATGHSYGTLLGRTAWQAWKRLERRHGDLGLRRCGLLLHGLPGPLERLPAELRRLGTAALPFARVDGEQLAAALPGALAAAGVRRLERPLLGLEPTGNGGWWLQPADGGAPLQAGQVLLAAGAGCRRLWPDLPPRFGVSWGGVLELSNNPDGQGWLGQARRGRALFPRRLERPLLERGLTGAAGEPPGNGGSCVDVSLAAWGRGVLVGQVCQVQAALDPEPEAAALERQLRQALARFDPALERRLAGAGYTQVPVPFCADGAPLLGPLAAGLWVCSGFRGAFSQAPEAVDTLAARMLAESGG